MKAPKRASDILWTEAHHLGQRRVVAQEDARHAAARVPAAHPVQDLEDRLGAEGAGEARRVGAVGTLPGDDLLRKRVKVGLGPRGHLVVGFRHGGSR